MRKLRFYIIAAILLTVAACAEEKTTDENRVLPEFETFEFEAITEDYSFTISYEQIVNISDNEAFALIDSMNYHNTFGEYALNEPDLQCSSELMMADMLDDMNTFNFLGLSYEMHIYQVASLVRDDSVVCFDTVMENNLGGIHPMVNHTYECYDIESGNIYDFGYLNDGEWCTELGNIIYDKLKAEYGNAIRIPATSFAHLPEAIYLTDNGIALQYQPYEIGDATLGSVTVEITDEELEEVGAPIVWE